MYTRQHKPILEEGVKSSDSFRILVIGGSGFIGSYIVKECLRQGYRVSILSRSGRSGKGDNEFEGVDYIQGNITALSIEEYAELLQPFDGLVFAAGVDERVSPDTEDVYAFYAQANIEPCRRLFTAAQQSNITHAVLLNSIFAMVHRNNPELQLTDKHPYIRSRVDQNAVCQHLAQGENLAEDNKNQPHFILTTLEVPWVFGVPLQGGPSQWDILINYVRASVPIMTCRGGTNIIAVESVAQACVAALTKPTQSSVLPIGDVNISYENLLHQVCIFAKRKDQTISHINDQFFIELLKTGGRFKDLLGTKSGLDTKYAAELLLQDIEVDNIESQNLLGYQTGIALDALEGLVKSRPENALLTGWRKLLNVVQR